MAAEQQWWLETWRYLGGNPLRARALRAVGDGLPAGALWTLITADLRPLKSASGGSAERLGLALLLDMTLRWAPVGLGGLVRAIVGRDDVHAGFGIVAELAKALDVAFEGWRKRLGSTVDAAGIAWDVRADDASPEGRRRQLAALKAYAQGTTNMIELRLGIAAAAEWSKFEGLQKLLAGTELRLTPKRVFDDVLGHAVLAAIRARQQFAVRGQAPPVPDASAMERSGEVVAAVFGKAAQGAGAGAKAGEGVGAKAGPGAVAKTRAYDAPKAAERADAGVPAKAEPSRTKEIKRVVSVPLVKEPAPVEPQGFRFFGGGQDELWWVAARVWAKGRPAMLTHLLEVPKRFRKSPLWGLLVSEVRRLPIRHSLREAEIAHYAFAVLLDEFMRAFPVTNGDLLELLAVEPGEVVRSATVGELWVLLEPLFTSWACILDPKLEPTDRVKVGQTLHRMGDILPWDDAAKGSKEKRERAQDAAIDAVYLHGERDGDKPRIAVYWAATRARNDLAHRLVDSLRGRVQPLPLMTDVVVFAAIAAIRFRMRVADDNQSPPSLPSLAGLLLGVTDD